MYFYYLSKVHSTYNCISEFTRKMESTNLKNSGIICKENVILTNVSTIIQRSKKNSHSLLQNEMNLSLHEKLMDLSQKRYTKLLFNLLIK